MNSSMLAGERRWASARRGGMTVLGKVAAPKPLNLPSQRLENHGLDPNVEIVPKGTLGWGSRPSSSGSNPWVSSSQPPNVEGGTVSPSHISGRPSSGGGGTRPSTAGSERTHEPISGGAWGSTSRPSSASGTLSSDKTSSASLRPSSAENRPNSSQSHLSRFADPMSKNSAAWSPNVPGERMGTKSSKEDGFSLTSGDFPTLGTEKDNSMKITELEGHGRPSSASGRIPHGKDDTRDQTDAKHGKDDTRDQTDAKHGTVNTWRADGPQSLEDDVHPNIEQRQGDNPQYFNPNVPPHHFDAWRGPPMSGPSGVWYGGRPQGPLPFGSHVGPRGFPMEPFPYYRPQIAPIPLAGSQRGPPPGTRGSHPKNGDFYRPQMPDASYPRPGMSHRPGFYPGSHGPAFESFYGPPMGYERDNPYMGMPVPPPMYNNSYPGLAPNIGSSQSRDGHVRHAGKASSEQVEANDTRGPKRITLKSRNQRDQLEEGETQEHNLRQSEVSYPEKIFLPIISSRKNEWGAEEDPEEYLHPHKRTPGEYRAHSSDGVNVKSFEGMSSTKAVNDHSKNLPENVPPLGSVRDSSLPDVMNNSALMHKIDGMNAKIRIYDRRNDSVGAHNREEVRNRSQMIDTKTNNNTGELSNTVGSFERTPASRDFVSVPHGVAASVSNKPKQPTIVVSSRPHHGGQVRVEHRGRGKFSSQDADAWQKKSLSTESSSVVTASHIEYPTGSHAHFPVANVERDSVETNDSIGIQAQRTKMREIVKQRTLQLQKEEEERTKEQRAKALAKLEELNRRTLAGEDGSEKAEISQATNAIQGEQNESRVIDEPSMGDHTNTNQAGESVEEMPRILPSEPDASTNLPVQGDAHDGSVRKVSPQYNDSKHKRAGYKLKQNSSQQKNFAEKNAPNVAANNDVTSDEHRLSSEAKPREPSFKLNQKSSLQKSFGKPVPNAAKNDITSGKPCPSSEPKVSESNMPNTSDNVVEGVVSQRKKSNRGAKSKHKPDETPMPPLESSIDHAKESIENAEAKDSSSVSTEPEPNKAVKAQKVLSSSLPNDESNSSKISSQWRSHPSRKQPRNQHINSKPNSGGDTAVWAPVNKAKVSTETSSDAVPESSNLSKGNNNNILKAKRAEMERYVPKPVAKELSQQDYTQDVSVTSSGEVNKHRKDQGVWKQRGPPDPSHMKGSHVESQSVKSDFDSVNAEIRTSVKDRGATDKGKGNMTKGSASIGSNNTKTDHEKSFRSETDAFQVDQSIGSKENRASSHWQPKSSGSNTTSNQLGNRTEPLTTEGNRFPKKEHKAQGGNFNQTQASQSVGPGELTQDVHLDRNTRRNNRQNNRHESHVDWAPGHDNRPLNGPPFRDSRQRPNLHYEYQHVGPFKGNRPAGVEEPNDAMGGTSQGHRERGPRRGGGNFNRRQSEAVPADRE